MTASRLELLTDAQRECLRLVLTHHSSKEIAVLLKVSPSAVDKRLERAIQILGATSRFDAARRLAAAERGSAYEPLPCETIDLPSEHLDGAPERQNEPWGLVRRLLGMAPNSRISGTVRNPMTGAQRMMVILGLVLVIAIASLALVNIAVTLTQVIGPLRGVSGGASRPASAPAQ